jgi:hypothetical protein
MHDTVRLAIVALKDKEGKIWDADDSMDDNYVASSPLGQFCTAIHSLDPEILQWITYFCAKRSLSCWEVYRSGKEPREYVNQIGEYLKTKKDANWAKLKKPIKSPYGDCRYSVMASVAESISNSAKYIHEHNLLSAIYSISGADVAYDHVLTKDNFRKWLMDFATRVASEKREMNESEVDALRSSKDIKHVRFTPSRVEGLSHITEIAVYCNRIEFYSDREPEIIYFEEIAKPAGSSFSRVINRLFGGHNLLMIGERDWFHEPKDRFFRIFTEPQITFYMPVNDTSDYGNCCFTRILNIILSARYSTWDLG